MLNRPGTLIAMIYDVTNGKHHIVECTFDSNNSDLLSLSKTFVDRLVLAEDSENVSCFEYYRFKI